MINRGPKNTQSRRTTYWSGGVIGREQGTIVKDWGWRLPVALIYPNSYFLGMSNLGVQVIYRLLNDRDDTVCERVFWEGPGKAFESIESARSPGDYSCLAFTFSYELDYLNIALMLKTAGVPLEPKERKQEHPILMAGGPAVTANPAPLAPIFDALAIGEAEAILPAVIPVLSKGKNRNETLQELAALPGLFVPAYFDGRPVARQYLDDLSRDFPAHSTVLTPDTELGELYLLEIERGCSWGCCFCLVSHAFCPTRFRSLESLMGQARDGLKFRHRLGLVGPVVSDHPQIEALLQGLLEMNAGFSLSSLRLKPLPSSLLALIRRGGAETIALAPEAGTERLRHLIGKGFKETDILGAVGRAASAGFKQLKLYFMIGLPTETNEDADEIAKLALKCRGESVGALRLSVNIGPFVPKAGTPFQRHGMADMRILQERIHLVTDRLKGSGITVKSESPEWSQVQGALSRGDTRLARALAMVEVNSLAGWRRAVKRTGLDLKHYVNEEWAGNESLPWGAVEPRRNSNDRPRHILTGMLLWVKRLQPWLKEAKW